MFYHSQLEISFHMIKAESNFWVRTGETIYFAGKNTVSLLIFTRISTSTYSVRPLTNIFV